MSATRDLIEAYATAAPADAAMGLTALDAGEAAAVLADVDAPLAARLLQVMSRPAAAQALWHLDAGDAARVCRDLPAEILAAIVRRLGDDAPRLLGRLDAPVAEPVCGLLEYPDGTVGAALDPLVTAVQTTAPAGDVRAQLRRESSARVADHVYAVDDRGALAGVVDVAALLAAEPHAPVSSVTRSGIDRLRAETPLSGIEEYPGWQQYDALPVVDGAGRLMGVLRHRRLRQLAQDSAFVTRDDRGVRTLLALGEVYWLGLSGLLQGLAAAAATTTTQPARRDEEAR